MEGQVDGFVGGLVEAGELLHGSVAAVGAEGGFAAHPGGTFFEHAQNGRGIKRPPKRAAGCFFSHCGRHPRPLRFGDGALGELVFEADFEFGAVEAALAFELGMRNSRCSLRTLSVTSSGTKLG